MVYPASYNKPKKINRILFVNGYESDEVKGKIQIRLRILQTKADVNLFTLDTMSVTWHALLSTQQPVRL